MLILKLKTCGLVNGANMEEIFEDIKKYHLRLGYNYNEMGVECAMEAMRNNCLALHAEVAELLNSFPWKPWRRKRDQTLDTENAKEEVIDCLFFLGAICEIAGIQPTELTQTFREKLAENYRRLNNGYNKPKKEIERG